MNHLRLIVALLISTILLIINISLFYSSFYVFEIIVSTLPYLFVGISLISAFVFIYLIKTKKLQNIIKPGLTGFIISLGITFILISGGRIASFAYYNNSNQSNSGKEIKLAFFNTLYNNNDFEAINKQIRDTDADVLGLSEINPDRINRITSLKNYPYSISDTNIMSKDTAIYSKFPITQLTDVDQNTDFFIAGKILIDSKDYNIIVAHPVPPLNEYLNDIRAKVLSRLYTQINKIDKSNTILMGDFNLTPWSSKYNGFLKSLPQMKNTSKGEGINFTWNAGPIYLHIDHIFVSKDFYTKNYKIIGNAGSDHKMISTNIVFN